MGTLAFWTLAAGHFGLTENLGPTFGRIWKTVWSCFLIKNRPLVLTVLVAGEGRGQHAANMFLSITIEAHLKDDKWWLLAAAVFPPAQFSALSFCSKLGGNNTSSSGHMLTSSLLTISYSVHP